MMYRRRRGGGDAGGVAGTRAPNEGMRVVAVVAVVR